MEESSGVLKGGKCWFALESKTFEISIEVVQGVEAWYRGESSSRRSKVWKEEGRKFRMRCRSNEAGRFLLCPVRDVEAKKFCLVFPKGNGLVGGWFLLAKKLRALGVSTPTMWNSVSVVPTTTKMGSSVKGLENEPGSFAEVVKMKIEESEDSLKSIPLLPSLKRLTFESWLLKGDLRISRLGGALVLFEFQNKWEADMVLLRGSRRFKNREFILQMWGPEVGCTWKESHAKEVWVKVEGLPLHLWSREWAKILVKASGKKWSRSLQVEVGNSCWELNLWWEASPRVLHAESSSWLQMKKRREVTCGSGQRHVDGNRGKPAVALVEDSSVNGPRPKFVGWELLAVGETDVEGASLVRLKLTDEGILDEASRYPFHHKLSLLSLGLGASSPFLGLVGVVMGMEGNSNGLFGAAEGGAGGSELAIVPFGLGLESPLAEMMTLHLEEGEEEEDWRTINSRGTAGGVLVLWDNRLVELLEVKEVMFIVSCWFKNCVDELRWVFTGVYGPVYNRDREVFWEELRSIKGLWRDPGVSDGRSGAKGLPLIGGSVYLGILARPVSDHFPILLEGGGLKRGPSPFRFENMWLEKKWFMD
ncbi:hypothetical protein CK203_005809 [Vitis vinifera]|uniref:DUF4283 domain-containing protein n=1 Tax=Vitis vinifera TaxID=29760 RepID=A0A438K3Q5_VITVI|nr:hypothetical protein CK203_005809 [Vitis vinifera]